MNKVKLHNSDRAFENQLGFLYNFTLFILDIAYKIRDEYLSQSRDKYDFEEREKKYFRKPSYSYLI